MDVVILGGGVFGLVVATRLVEAGIVPRLCERGASLGEGAASWLAGGMLAPFCEAATTDRSIVAPGLSGINWWDHAAACVERHGTLVVQAGRDGAQLRQFAARAESHEWLDGAAIDALEPGLAGRFRQGLFFAQEAHMRPRLAMARLAESLSARGVSIAFGQPAEPADFGGAWVLDCRGARADVPGLRAVRGEMLIVQSDEIALTRPVRILHPRWPVYVVPHGAGRFMIGASMIESADARGVTLRSAVELMNVAYALHPAFADAQIVEMRSGLRPALPDNLPRYVASARGGALAGAYRHGFLLAPDIARQAVEALLQARNAA